MNKIWKHETERPTWEINRSLEYSREETEYIKQGWRGKQGLGVVYLVAGKGIGLLLWVLGSHQKKGVSCMDGG